MSHLVLPKNREPKAMCLAGLIAMVLGLQGFAPDEIAALKKNLVTVYRNLDVLDREISEELITTDKKAICGNSPLSVSLSNA